MVSQFNNRMFIYICGPYAGATPREIHQNIKKADKAGQRVLSKGHFPLVPHTMMNRWQDLPTISRGQVLQAGHAWLKKCDAILCLGSSEGASQELDIAKKIGLKIFYKIEDIPDVSGD